MKNTIFTAIFIMASAVCLADLPQNSGERGLMPIPAGYPSADTTGPAAAGYTELTEAEAVTLRDPFDKWHPAPEWCKLQDDGSYLIEGMHFTSGTLDIYHPNIHIRGCKFELTKHYCVSFRPSASGCTIEYCEVSSRSGDCDPEVSIKESASAQHALSYGISASADNITIRHNNIYWSGDGIIFGGSDVTITDNYIHDLTSWQETHNDGVQMFGNQHDLLIKHNSIIMCLGDRGLRQTGAVSLFMDRPSPCSYQRVQVEDNFVAGGSFTFYGGGSKNPENTGKNEDVKFINNKMSTYYFPKCGYWGQMAYGSEWGENGNEYTDNDLVPGE